MGKIKTTRTVEITFTSASGLTADDLTDFLKGIPGGSKLKFKEPTSYPGEYGETPGYISATWEDLNTESSRAED
jgi:hypothetical protein